jgi:hypothetical protein
MLVAGLALAAQAGAAAELQLQPAAAYVVASIAGPSVRVHCTAPHGNLFQAVGHVDWTQQLIELAPSVCRRVNALVDTPATPHSRASYAQAEAMLVLVHESVHLSRYAGRRDEALTECRALQLVEWAALTAGIDDATASVLGHEALRADAKLPGLGDWRVGLREIPNYHATGCVDGGPLDIHPDSHDWPN